MHQEQELVRGIDRLGLTPEEASVCDSTTAGAVVRCVKKAFGIEGDPSWLWDQLGVPYDVYEHPGGDGYLHFLDYVPAGDQKCWLIISGPGIAWLVADLAVAILIPLIEECYGFEDYYVVGKRFDWLVCETHHNQLIVARRPSSLRLGPECAALSGNQGNNAPFQRGDSVRP